MEIMQPKSTKDRYCINCKYVSKSHPMYFSELLFCLHPDRDGHISNITGKKSIAYCNNERGVGNCGKEGKLFEEKPLKKSLLQSLKGLFTWK